jgi:hypothetical protein
MFHGGQNPEGKFSTMQESSASGFPNDLPVKSYDFNAPIGEYGQLNPQYFWLRRLHLFLHDFGGALATMPTTMPSVLPENKSDTKILRWSVRSDGNTGFVFVNNYERLRPLPAKTDVQFNLHLPSGELIFPQKPVTVPADSFFIWPFNLDLGGAKLIYATAQPICREGSTFYFAETLGVKTVFSFAPNSLTGKKFMFENVVASRKPAFELQTKSGQKVQVVLLNEADSLVLQKTNSKFVFEKPAEISATKVKVELLQSARPAREISLSTDKSHIALAPTDADWANAAVWKIKLPAKTDLNSNPLLRVCYVGDCARLTLNGRLLDDNFYSGRNFEIGLKRYGSEILTGDLRLEILPLRKDAPIFFEPKDKPNFGSTGMAMTLKSAEIIVQ